jgi:arylsulfatase
MQGQSLLPVLLGENTIRKKPIFWEWSDGQAAWFDSYKIVKEGLENPWELYNIESDPTETNNLSETYPQKVKELENLFITWKSELPQF